MDSLSFGMAASAADRAGAAATAGAVDVASTASSAATTMDAASNRAVGIVYDKVMEYHVREDHPEHPDRVRVLNERLREAGLLDRCIQLPSKLATDEELRTSHSQDHIDKVTSMYSSAPDMRTDEGELLRRIGDTFIITGDIYCNTHTNEAARSAAGCAVQAVEAVLSGQVESAFAIVRPPGHHAEPSGYMGFCFFNNVAVAAHAALKHPGIQRVLILDWDVHAGNGTQKVFYEDDRVLFVSLHRRDKDFYPEGIGYATEVGEGAGRGYNVNVPWAETKMGDGDYMAAFELVLEPIISEFDPQLVIISAGFDAAEGDFLGKCMVSPEGFGAMTTALMRHAGGKVVAVLEGGYVPSILGECAAAVLSRLLGDPALPLPASTLSAIRSKTGASLAKVDEQHRPFWKRLAAQPPFESAFKAYKAQQQLAALCIGGSRRSSTGMVTRRQGASGAGPVPAAGRGAAAAAAPGTATGQAGICGSICLMPAGVGSAPMPLAARAPTLRSAAAAAARRGVKGSAKAAAGASAVTGLPPAAVPAGAAQGSMQGAAVAATEAPAPQPAALMPQQVQDSITSASGSASASMPAASIPGAPAAGAGRKIRIKLAGKTPAAGTQVSAPGATAAAGAAAAAATAAPPAAAELPLATTPKRAKQVSPEPSTLSNLTTPVVATSSSSSSSQRIDATAVTPAAAVSPVASEARAAVAEALPSPVPAAVAAASRTPPAAPAASPPRVAEAPASASAAAASSAGQLSSPPLNTAAQWKEQQSPPATAAEQPAAQEQPLPGPVIGAAAAHPQQPVPSPPAAHPQPPPQPSPPAPQPQLPPAVVLPPAAPVDMAVDGVPAPGTPAEHSAQQRYAAAAAPTAEEEGSWAGLEAAQLQPPTPAAAEGVVDRLTADLLRMAVQEAADVPLSP